MIHDVEVICDGEGCNKRVRVPLQLDYTGGHNGTWEASNDEIVEALADHDWITRDGNHFCDEECAG